LLHYERQKSMDARITRAAFVTVLLLVSMGARHRSANFIVETADPNMAAQFAEAAEKYRHDLAVEWLGQPMPNWSQPCPMTVMVGQNLGAGGATTFVFDRGEVFGWRMSIQGSQERVLDSVLPHEITHMIFASQFRRPLPRWADEGGATTVENISERSKYQRMLDQFLRTGRGIAFSRMFAMTDYPHDVMPLYAQGYSLAEYLIQIGGRRRYVEFLNDALKSNDWPGAIARNYGVTDLGQLQNTWLAWVKQGSPAIGPSNIQPGLGASPEMLAANTRVGRAEPISVYQPQGQNRAQPKVVPAGGLVPVPGSLLGRIKAVNNTVPESKKTLAPKGGVQVASAASEPTPTGWRTAGSRSVSPAAALAQSSPNEPNAMYSATTMQPSQPPEADPFQSQAARPQDAEQPRQIIMEWSAR
jgi:hypothetical protein